MTHTEEWYKNWKTPWPEIAHGQTTKWGWRVDHPEGLRMGRFVDLGFAVYIQAAGRVILEDEVEVGGGSMLYSVSTIDKAKAPIYLERNCKIGAHCTILPGVRVGENSIVGAGTVLSRNQTIPPNVVVCDERHLVFRSLETSFRRSEAI